MASASGQHGQSTVRPTEVQTFRFEDDGSIPNNPQLPFLVYQGALDPSATDLAAASEEVFEANGWGGGWRNGIFPYPHYHSTAHEVLGICRGEARVRFGGETGTVLTMRPGDVVVIPAGVGHQNLGASGDLLVVGAYPAGESWDLCYGRPEERPRVLDNIRTVPLPTSDPVYGSDGPLIREWQRS